jgi:hypothetical protein
MPAAAAAASGDDPLVPQGLEVPAAAVPYVDPGSEYYDYGGPFVRGLKSGTANMQSLAYGFAAMMTDMVGAEMMREHMVKGAEAKRELSGVISRDQVTTPDDIQSGEDFANYVQYTLGNLAPSVAEVFGSMILGAAVGSATAPGPGAIPGAAVGVTAGRETIKQALKKWTAKKALTREERDIVNRLVKESARRSSARAQAGATLGARGATYQIGAGDVYMESVEAGDPSPWLAAGAALPYAYAEAAVPLALGRWAIQGGLRGLPKGVAARRAGAAVAAGGVGEMGTEATQEEILIQTRGYLEPGYDLMGTDAMKRRRAAAAAGLIGGVAIGAGGTTVKTLVKADGVESADLMNPEAKPVAATSDEVNESAGAGIDEELAAPGAVAAPTETVLPDSGSPQPASAAPAPQPEPGAMIAEADALLQTRQLEPEDRQRIQSMLATLYNQLSQGQEWSQPGQNAMQAILAELEAAPVQMEGGRGPGRVPRRPMPPGMRPAPVEEPAAPAAPRQGVVEELIEATPPQPQPGVVETAPISAQDRMARIEEEAGANKLQAAVDRFDDQMDQIDFSDEEMQYFYDKHKQNFLALREAIAERQTEEVASIGNRLLKSARNRKSKLRRKGRETAAKERAAQETGREIVEPAPKEKPAKPVEEPAAPTDIQKRRFARKDKAAKAANRRLRKFNETLAGHGLSNAQIQSVLKENPRETAGLRKALADGNSSRVQEFGDQLIRAALRKAFPGQPEPVPRVASKKRVDEVERLIQPELGLIFPDEQKVEPPKPKAKKKEKKRVKDVQEAEEQVTPTGAEPTTPPVAEEPEPTVEEEAEVEPAPAEPEAEPEPTPPAEPKPLEEWGKAELMTEAERLGVVPARASRANLIAAIEKARDPDSAPFLTGSVIRTTPQTFGSVLDEQRRQRAMLSDDQQRTFGIITFIGGLNSNAERSGRRELARNIRIDMDNAADRAGLEWLQEQGYIEKLTGKQWFWPYGSAKTLPSYVMPIDVFPEVFAEPTPEAAPEAEVTPAPEPGPTPEAPTVTAEEQKRIDARDKFHDQVQELRDSADPAGTGQQGGYD